MTQLSRIQLTQYGFLAAPVAFAGYPLYVLAPDFYAVHQGVSLSVLGMVLLGLRIFDAIQDPFIGQVSDQLSGKTLPLMLASALFLVASIYTLFNPIGAYAVAWFAASMLVAVTAYSVLSINLNTLGALWTNDRHEQTRIAGTREAYGLVGLLFAVTLPGILEKYLPPGQVFTWFSVVLSGLMIFAMVAFSRWFSQRHAFIHPENTPSQKLSDTLRLLPTQTRKLFMVYAISVLASSIPAVLVLFFIRDRLNSEAYTGLFLLLYFLSGALTMPVWKNLSERYGKPLAWLLSMLLAVTGFIWAFFLGGGDVWQYCFVCVASGTALGADLALPPSILADHVYEHRSEATAATQFSMLTLLAKAGLAMGSAIALPLLDLAGFVPAAINDKVALAGLSIAYALIPCLIKLAAAYLLYRFFITSQRTNRHESSAKNHLSGSRHNA